MRYFVDTNVLLRFRNRVTHITVRAAVRILKARGNEVVTAAQNIAEFWNALTRPATARRLWVSDTRCRVQAALYRTSFSALAGQSVDLYRVETSHCCAPRFRCAGL